MSYLYKDLDLGFLHYKECVGGTYIYEHYRCKNCPYRYKHECIIRLVYGVKMRMKTLTLKEEFENVECPKYILRAYVAYNKKRFKEIKTYGDLTLNELIEGTTTYLNVLRMNFNIAQLELTIKFDPDFFPVRIEDYDLDSLFTQFVAPTKFQEYTYEQIREILKWKDGIPQDSQLIANEEAVK